MDNPFKPKEVKLYNYNKENIENHKLENIGKRLHEVNNGPHEYQIGYKPKSYGDVLKKLDTYSNHLPQKPGYGDIMRRNNGFKNN